MSGLRRELWDRHGDAAQLEQSEAFWLALEAELPEREREPEPD